METCGENTQPKPKTSEDDLLKILQYLEILYNLFVKDGTLWYYDRVIWTNITLIAIILATLLLNYPQYAVVAGVVLGVLNAVLRFLTTGPVETKKSLDLKAEMRNRLTR